MKLVRISSLLIAVLISLDLSGCCRTQPELRSGPRPDKVHGWEEFQVGSVTVKGEFVLNKAESANNGQVGIRIIDIYPGKCHMFDVPEFPSAKIQFFRVSDNAAICEWVFKPGGNRLDLPHICNHSLPWAVIYISDINSNENWVFFDLR